MNAHTDIVDRSGPDSARPATEAAADLDNPIHGLTPQHIREVLMQAGCRAEITLAPDGTDMVSSALHGTGFTVRFVNAYVANPQMEVAVASGFSDISFVYLPRIDGLPDDSLPTWLNTMVSDWNGSRRFAHVAVISNGESRFLALRWDVLVLGVTRDYLHACVRLWDQLMQEFFLFLRNHANRGAVAESSGQHIHTADTQG